MGERGSPPELGTDASAIAESVGRPERFAIVFDRHFAAVHRYLARRVGRELADDLASLCFTVAFERRSSFDPQFGSARPWLYGIATNLLRENWRAEQRSLAIVAQLSRERTGLDGEPIAEGGDVELARALGSLEPAQRDVLLLYAWEELTYEEISAAIGVPVGTVRSRLARARARMRAELETPRHELVVNTDRKDER
jgi:RNA polymerase sigma factor (sigma-70 family)